MSVDTVLTDADKDNFVSDLVDYGTDFVAPLYAVVESIEQAVLQSPEVLRLREDAELGEVAMKFVDRAGDHCKEDPAERICDEFSEAMADVVDRHCAMGGMPSDKYDSTGNLK